MTRVRLRVWVMPTHERMATLTHLEAGTAPFLARHPGVEIEWRLIQWNVAWQELMRAFKAGVGPDVLQVGTTWLAPMAHLGMLAELPSGFASNRAVASWVDDVVRYKGVSRGAAWMLDTTCFAVREDVFSVLSMDPLGLRTWEDLLVAADRLSNGLERGVLQSLGCTSVTALPPRPEPLTLHRIAPWLRAGGWSIPNLDGQGAPSILGSPDMQTGLQFISQLISISKLDLEASRIHPYRMQADFFSEGRHAFMVTSWSDLIRALAPQIQSLRYPIVAAPFPLGPHGSVPFAGGSLLCVSAFSKQQDLAWELVEALLDPHFMLSWSVQTGAPPARMGAFWERYADVPSVGVLLATLQDAKPYAIHPLWRSVEARLAEGVGDMLWSLMQHGLSDQVTDIGRQADVDIGQLLQLYWGGEGS